MIKFVISQYHFFILWYHNITISIYPWNELTFISAAPFLPEFPPAVSCINIDLPNKISSPSLRCFWGSVVENDLVCSLSPVCIDVWKSLSIRRSQLVQRNITAITEVTWVNVIFWVIITWSNSLLIVYLNSFF